MKRGRFSGRSGRFSETSRGKHREKYHKIQKTDAEPTRNDIGTDSENGTDPAPGNYPGTPTRPETIRMTAMNTGTHLIN